MCNLVGVGEIRQGMRRKIKRMLDEEAGRKTFESFGIYFITAVGFVGTVVPVLFKHACVAIAVSVRNYFLFFVHNFLFVPSTGRINCLIISSIYRTRNDRLGCC